MRKAEEPASCHQNVQQSQAVAVQAAGNQARGCHDDLYDTQTVLTPAGHLQLTTAVSLLVLC